MALKRLQTEYTQYLKDVNNHYCINPDNKNFYIWNILLFGIPGTIFEGGIFECQLIFPTNYPNRPPEFKFITKFPHPNIYPDGKVCMSILHEGIDEMNYEHISERWNPSHNVNSILISILSILSEPNLDSSANIDATLLWRNNWNTYKNIIYSVIANTH